MEDRCLPVFVSEEVSNVIHPRNSANKKSKQQWAEEGIFYRNGKWTKEESDRLLENWQSYLVENPSVENPLRLFDRRRDAELIDIAKRTDFFIHIAKTLNRSTYSCYTKLHRLVHTVTLKTQKFSKKEVKKLKKYIRKYGYNHKLIADLMKRDSQSILDKIRTISKEVNLGLWSPEEETLLLEALKDVTGVDNLIDVKHFEIPWKRIAKKVPSRHDEQCRKHFLHIKHWKLQTDLNKLKWRKRHTRLLIEKMTEGNYQVETDIDWAEMNELFDEVSPSPSYLESRFHRLKSTLFDYHKKTYCEAMELLRERYCKNMHE